MSADGAAQEHRSEKRTLLQLSEMLGTLGYRTALIGKKGIHGQQLIGRDPEHAA